VQKQIKILYFLLFVTILCAPPLIWTLPESVSSWKARNYPVVEGKILSREPLKTFILRRLYYPTVQITIQIIGTETKVQSIMSQSALEKLPEIVRFHFGGNANDRIFVEGRENDLWSDLLLVFTLFMLWMVYLNRKLLMYLHTLFTVSRRGTYP
jgi:hypothetical protein